jgi:hypothetical protein
MPCLATGGDAEKRLRVWLHEQLSIQAPAERLKNQDDQSWEFWRISLDGETNGFRAVHHRLERPGFLTISSAQATFSFQGGAWENWDSLVREEADANGLSRQHVETNFRREVVFALDLTRVGSAATGPFRYNVTRATEEQSGEFSVDDRLTAHGELAFWSPPVDRAGPFTFQVYEPGVRTDGSTTQALFPTSGRSLESRLGGVTVRMTLDSSRRPKEVTAGSGTGQKTRSEMILRRGGLAQLPWRL